MRSAMSFFRQAIDLDPTYALAYVGLAECFVTVRVHSWSSSRDTVATAKAAAAKAIDIDYRIAEAHATAGVLRMISDWDWTGAEESFRYAIELAPDYATGRNWYANYLVTQLRFDDAIREANQAVTLDPLSAIWRTGVGHMQFLARRYDEAVQSELDALEIDSRFWLSHWVLGLAFEQLGDRARAVDSLRVAEECSGGNPMVRGLLGRLLAIEGHVVEARGILDALVASDGRHGTPCDLVGLIHAGLGDTESAFDWFERSAQEGSYLLAFLNASPLFDSVRAAARFTTLQHLVKLA
jgi:tetratricopeptide (TPR) repeat protein